MKKLLLKLLCLPIIGFGQSYSIDQHNLQMNGNANDPNISINTYYNTLDTCIISWNIIQRSVPSEWDFSICFPYCYAIGLTNSQNLISPNEQVYLNCHIYPNNMVGNGIMQLEITTNNLHKDTVTWIVSVSSVSNTDQFNVIEFDKTHPFKKIDFFGRETKGKTNQPLFYIYDDGTVEKKIILE